MLGRVTLLLACMPVLGGCFTYSRIQPDQVTPEMSVRARLVAERGSGPVEGTVFEVGPRSFSVLPDVSGGMSTEPVALVFDEIELVEQRSFNGTRTALLAAATVAVGVATLYTVEVVTGGGRQPGGSGDFTLIPAFRIPVGR